MSRLVGILLITLTAIPEVSADTRIITKTTVRGNEITSESRIVGKVDLDTEMAHTRASELNIALMFAKYDCKAKYQKFNAISEAELQKAKSSPSSESYRRYGKALGMEETYEQVCSDVGKLSSRASGESLKIYKYIQRQIGPLAEYAPLVGISKAEYKSKTLAYALIEAKAKYTAAYDLNMSAVNYGTYLLGLMTPYTDAIEASATPETKAKAELDQETLAGRIEGNLLVVENTGKQVVAAQKAVDLAQDKWNAFIAKSTRSKPASR